MAIGKAIQKGTLVYIYNEEGRPLTSISAPGSSVEDGLQGFTSSVVKIRKGSLVYAYNEKGHVVGRTPAEEDYPAAA